MSDNNFMEGDLVKWMKLKPLTLDSTNTLLGECIAMYPSSLTKFTMKDDLLQNLA